MTTELLFISFIVNTFCASITHASSFPLSSEAHLPSFTTPCYAPITQPIRPDCDTQDLMISIIRSPFVIMPLVSHSCPVSTVVDAIVVTCLTLHSRQDAKKNPLLQCVFCSILDLQERYHLVLDRVNSLSVGIFLNLLNGQIIMIVDVQIVCSFVFSRQELFSQSFLQD